MDFTAWITHAQTRIDILPSLAERAWAWAYLARSLALADLSAAPPGRTTDAVWVVPAMTWTLGDLTDAGVHGQAPDVRPVRSGEEQDAVAACLRQLMSVLAVDDPQAPLPIVDACASAARRACVTFERLTGTLP